MKKYLIIVILLGLLGCKKSDSTPTDGFDRAKMLENYAQNLIKPAFLDLQTQVNGLKTATDNFVQSATEHGNLLMPIILVLQVNKDSKKVLLKK